MQIIDYSSYSSFQFCPWRWYENYVRGMQRRYDGQRDDPLTLGSLVHNALDNFSKTGRPEIDAECVADNNPTPDCYATATRLVQGYVLKFPSERWPVEATEAPLMFPLGLHEVSPNGGTMNAPILAEYVGLAKVDGYFYVPEDTTLESGMVGDTLTLSRGWWAREYKTKSPAVDRSKWTREWQSKRQADFQMLALQEFLRSKSYEWYQERRISNSATVQGIMVCVLEKPREYIPVRTCQGCKQKIEFRNYFQHKDGHCCPLCGTVQVFAKQKALKEYTPEYFRITVVRSPEQLDVARQEIEQVAMEMEGMRRDGMASRAPDRDSCISNRYHSPCVYANEHTAGAPVEEGQYYVQVDPLKYIGLPEDAAA